MRRFGRLTGIKTLGPRQAAEMSTQPLVTLAARSASLFSFTHAITRALPQSFAEHAIRSDSSKKIEMARAVSQWQNYTAALKKSGLEVVTLPADERYPDCVFVEDTALVVGQKACLLRPGRPSRRGEVQAMGDLLRSLKVEVTELDDPSALVDGGDIIFTGQEILIGAGDRSNKAATESLQRVFRDFPVTSIPVKGCLHLKSVASLLQDGIIAVGGSPASSEVLKYLKQRAQGKYKFIQLSDDHAANAVFVHDSILIKSRKEIGPANFRKLTEAVTVPVTEVEFDEFYKVDGCLTCCSILLRAPSK